jgi:hypothetical protein
MRSYPSVGISVFNVSIFSVSIFNGKKVLKMVVVFAQ